MSLFNVRVTLCLLCAFSLFAFFPPPAAAVLNDDTEFARQAYRDFLNREPDIEGLNYWTLQLQSGTHDRAELVEQFLLSAEFGGQVAPVVRLYFAYFNRLPDFSGLMYWVKEHSSGNLTLDNISDFFASSPEFQQTYGSLNNGQFVELVYQNVLGREPDAAGLAYWTGQLDTAARTRGQVMTGFSESAEYKLLQENPVYVTMTYVGLLRRTPELDGFNYWVGIMDQGATGLALIDGFLYSSEYEGRFNGTWVITGLEISGPSSVEENRSAGYSATATWEGGRTSLATPLWSENSGYASIGADGILTTSPVNAAQDITITASLTSGGVTREDTHPVTITKAPATVVSLAIDGPATVSEGSSAGYTATAFWSDGSFNTVTPTWDENSPFASIASNGMLTTTNVSGNQIVTISASYTFGGITQNQTKPVTIEDLDWVPFLAVGVNHVLSIDAYATN
ncbi:MAG: DUF4214 domain-containing protein, partial [Desulfuromonadales bacterium]|nr:DUF4214 domain-containing protein [Desulfuromonadales bacterium]